MTSTVLVGALLSAIVAFVLLIASLMTGNLLFAWACIAASAAGAVLLVADIFGRRR